MASRHSRHEQWRRTKNGTWTLSLGRRGHRVRLFEKTKGGMIYREVQLPGGKKTRASLDTRDRALAERKGREIMAGLLTGSVPSDSGPIKLSELCRRFVEECAMFLDNKPHTRADYTGRMAILRAALGESRDVRTLTEHDVRHYEARRRTGGIRYGADLKTGPVGQRSVQSDMKLLKQMLTWACTVPTVGGGRWLERNPLEYVRIAGERNIQRPVASLERFEATRLAMQECVLRYSNEALSAETTWERSRAERRTRSWLRAELALVLLEATGKRRGAIMGLTWADIDFAGRRITWQAAYDKKGKSRVVPYPGALFDAIRDFQKRLGALGGFVFPSSDDPERPAARELLSQWLVKAEEKAGLSKLSGGVTHPYRRKWRSERSHLPMKAVAVAGGWDDLATMNQCYDQPDDEDLLTVTSETRKRREGPVQLTKVAST
jgi:integrase